MSNNPLAYTDPTGHWGAQQQGYLRLAGAIAVAVATAGTAGPVVGQMTATQMGVYMAGGFASGAFATGNLRGAVTGSFTSLALAGLASKLIGQEKTLDAVLANAAAGGVVDQINGGKFGHGFVSAGFTAALVPHISTSNDFADGVLHAIVGGTASELAGGKFANGALTAAFSIVVSRILTSFDLAEGGTASTEPTPDWQSSRRLRTFYKALASMDEAGILVKDGTKVIYRDVYSYIDKQNNQRFCSSNCDRLFDQGTSLVQGQFNRNTKLITLFRSSVEHEFVGLSGEVNGQFVFSMKYSTNSGIETATKLGHEAHSFLIDMGLPAAAPHPNAEAAGRRALDFYRRARGVR